jgi:hypothetical protein
MTISSMVLFFFAQPFACPFDHHLTSIIGLSHDLTLLLPLKLFFLSGDEHVN